MLHPKYSVFPTIPLCATLLLPSLGQGVPRREPSHARGIQLALAPTDGGDTLTVNLSTITTDTGAFAPGHREFSRYGTIGLCLAAAHVAQGKFQHTLAAQAVGDTLVDDTIGLGGAAQVARACGARFTIANTPAREFPDLFELALAEQNSELAQAALAQLVAHAPTADARNDLWTYGLESYLRVGWRAVADTLMVQVDTRGPSARRAQLAMHRDLQYEYEWKEADTVRYRAESQRLLGLTETAPIVKDVASYRAEVQGFEGVMKRIVWEGRDSVSALALRAKRALSKYADTPAVTTWWGWRPWPSLSADQVIDSLAPAWYAFLHRGGGGMAPRLRADYWFPAPGAPASDTVRPVRGKVNLICQGRAITDDRSGMTLKDYDMAAQIRRWLAQYGADQLDVTIVRRGVGSIDQHTRAFEGAKLFPSPALEAHAWQWYEHDYAYLPVTVAVQMDTAITLPVPDSLLKDVGMLQFNDFWLNDPTWRDWALRNFKTSKAAMEGIRPDKRPGEMPGMCVVIGRDGTIVYADISNQRDRYNTGAALRWQFAPHTPLSSAATPVATHPISQGLTAPGSGTSVQTSVQMHRETTP